MGLHRLMSLEKKTTRREMLKTTAAVAAAAGAASALPGRAFGALVSGRGPMSAPFADPSPVKEKVPLKLQPFPLAQVRLRSGPFMDTMNANLKYMTLLPPDRLLHTFRINANLPTTAEPLGGWEQPNDPNKTLQQNRISELRGHFTGGHFLSASAMMYASTGDDSVKSKADLMVAELAKCQQALGGEYLSAFPTSFFDRLLANGRVWAPFYTYHKIMAGHIDMYQLTGNEQALANVEGMARWVGKWVKPLDDETMTRVKRDEFGGMAEALYNLYGITGKEEYLETGHRFDDKVVFDPLAAGQDKLNGLHANTNIPKIIGCARAYELTGEPRYRDIANNFWNIVTSQHIYCTGGTSDGEHWHEPGQISKELGPSAEECCCSYNMMKLTRHLYGWTGDPSKLDYYERLLFNVRLGTVDPDGMTMYFVSMEPNLYRTFSTPYNSFWCCDGTGIEDFSKLADTIYFHDAKDLYVNLFIASDLDWKEKGLRVTQETSFPQQDSTTLTFTAEHPVKMDVNIRIPYWAAKGATIKVNGKHEKVHAQPSTYAKLRRTWKTGDKVEISIPMSLHTAPTPDDPTVLAVMYGPMVLAGITGSTSDLPERAIYGPNAPRPPRPANMPPPQPGQRRGRFPQPPPPTIKGNAADVNWVELVPGDSLAFKTVGQPDSSQLVPFYKIFHERYTTYWKVTSA
ncbi:MAG TPA: beta-L-arabinofuranosidase domain-containing protein [Candidatus Acidoferrales bacterium]|nr:beta-L-arabinofuranosidase domain-containing protein [Candidatus Acidoferrales bacterium]